MGLIKASSTGCSTRSSCLTRHCPPPLFRPVIPPLGANLSALQDRIASAAAAAHRDAATIQLLPVTKAVNWKTTRALIDLGQLDLAENRLDGLQSKTQCLAQESSPPAVTWHFIGHLQRNKARKVLGLAHTIHSIDSLALAETTARICVEEGWDRKVYLQLNLTGEATKYGMQSTECAQALKTLASCPQVRILGLMGMGPLQPRPTCDAASTFRELSHLARSWQSKQPDAFEGGRCGLSMGMSSDLEQAVQAGSTCLRIGSDLYRKGSVA